MLSYIRKHGLLKAGDRLGLAVSGGADSVSMLLALLELRTELGIVISVVHFNHQIRGAEADADERFVSDLAARHGLEFYCASGDAPARAEEMKESLETAARELRYGWFHKLLGSDVVDKIATAHTMDDQAETFLLRLLRGAGTRGLGGIHPQKSESPKSSIVRPLLEVRRSQVEAYLKLRGQIWREDATNSDHSHARNKIRHDLLPLLARDYNPAIVETLARSADIARAEEEYWESETARLLPFVLLPGKPVRGGGRDAAGKSQSSGLSIEALHRQPLAMQRRLIRVAAESLGIPLDIAHLEELLALTISGKGCELPGGWRAERTFRELRFELNTKAGKPSPGAGYEYDFPVPGELAVPGANLVIHAHLLPVEQELGAYNHRTSPDRLSGNQADNGAGATRTSTGGAFEFLFGEDVGNLQSLGFTGGELTLRNWRPGDRFRPAQSGSEKKVKELLEDLKVPQAERRCWPVLAAGKQLIWVRGTRPLTLWVEQNGNLQRLVIEAREVKVPTDDIDHEVS